jgi:hypothetical protein
MFASIALRTSLYFILESFDDKFFGHTKRFYPIQNGHHAKIDKLQANSDHHFDVTFSSVTKEFSNQIER